MKKTSSMILILFQFLSLSSQDIEKYKYPITPEDKEWKTNNYIERLEILAIENETLKSLSNIQLIGACYEFPYVINMYAFNSLEEGYQNVYASFNGLRELHRREDIGEDLVNFYSKMGVEGFEGELSVYNEHHNVLTLTFFEVLLSREDILSKMQRDQKEALVDACISKYHLKDTDNHTYNGEPIFNKRDKKITLTILSQLLLIDGSGQDKEQASQFMKSGTFDIALINSIITRSQQLY